MASSTCSKKEKVEQNSEDYRENSKVDKLRNEVFAALKEQGFVKDGDEKSVSLAEHSKEVYKNVQKSSRREKLKKHKNFIMDNFDEMKNYTVSGNELDPEKIDLELRLVDSRSLEEKIFRWWNFVWWSVPYQRAYGRQMRWVIWDVEHNAPFGLIGLHSPGLRLSARDDFLGIEDKDRDWWVNQSLSAQRVGALPPYNDLIGGKMVALGLVCKELREAYYNKYKDYETIIKKRNLPARLLFVTTTGAFGKTSIYNRLKMNGIEIAKLIGYTKGSGTFHIPEKIYQKLLEFLDEKGIDTETGFGTGSSRKRQLVSKAFNLLDLPGCQYHGIKRSVYLFQHCKNVKKVIQNNESPQWYNWEFEELFKFWRKRWGLPRAERIDRWKNFDQDKYFQNVKKEMEEL